MTVPNHDDTDGSSELTFRVGLSVGFCVGFRVGLTVGCLLINNIKKLSSRLTW